MKEGYHKTKSGKVAKKGLYYYMNKEKNVLKNTKDTEIPFTRIV